MAEWLRKLFGLCDHDWEHVGEVERKMQWRGEIYTTGYAEVDKCRKCDEFRRRWV